MNQLLKLYIPKLALGFLGYVIITLVLIILGIYFPADPGSKYAMIFAGQLIVTFVFYFWETAYLPLSLNWILLSPISKKSIIGANFIINLLKVLLISIFYLSFALIVPKYATFLGKVTSELSADDTLMSAVFFSTFILSSLIIFLTCGLYQFGASSYISSPVSIRKNPRLLIKKYLGAILIATFIYTFFLENEFIYTYMPNFIRYPLVFFIGMYLASISTFKSLQLYYSIQSLRLILSSLFILFSIIFYNLIVKDLNNPSISINQKIDTFNLLGPLANNKRELIQRILLSPSKNLENLDKELLSDLFKYSKASSHFNDVHEQWLRNCESETNFYCRLSSYLVEQDQKSTKIDLLMKGCSNDIISCKILTGSKDVPKAYLDKATRKLESVCIEGNENFGSNSCKDFIRNK